MKRKQPSTFRPTIGRGEFAAGYLADVACLNLWKLIDERNDWPPGVRPKDLLALPTVRRIGASLAMQLAELAGVDARAFVREHTNAQFTVAFRPTATRTQELFDAASDDGSVAQLRICSHCVEQDLKDLGRACYHAEHQMRGHFWCRLHGHAQLRVTPLGQVGWARPPDTWLDEAGAAGREWASMTAAEQQQASWYLERSESVARSQDQALLDALAVPASFLKRPAGPAPLFGSLSDQIWDMFPHWWLIDLDPAWVRKSEGASQIWMQAYDPVFWTLAQRVLRP